MSDSAWKHCTLDDLVETNPEALSGSTPLSSRFQYIDINSVTLGKVDWQNVTEVEFKTAPSRARRIVRPGDTMFCTVRPSLQAHAYADWSDCDGYICSTGFAVLRPKQTDKRFVFHTVFSEAVASHVRRREVGSSYPAVNESELNQTPLWVPQDEIEQSRIAEILDTLDAAIRETEAVVAKLRQVKAGLLHDLLTRGLDEHGQLRDPTRHPEQFQDSVLGRIPRDWQLLPLGQILREHGGFLQTGPFGSQLHSRDYSSEGVAVLMPQDIRDDGTMDDNQAAKIMEARAIPLARHRLRANDLVFARRGDLSRCCVVESGKNAICGTGCLLFRPPSKSICSIWFAAIYRHDTCQRQIAARAVGTTMVNLNTELLSGLWLRFPSFEEQDQIAERLVGFERRFISEQERLAKLHSLKRGLAHDLLTGRVRVKLDAGRNHLAQPAQSH